MDANELKLKYCMDRFSAEEFNALKNRMKSTDTDNIKHPVSTTVKNCKIIADVWSRPRNDGINKGRVTKLYVNDPNGKTVAAYRDGKWILKPSGEYKAVVDAYLARPI